MEEVFLGNGDNVIVKDSKTVTMHQALTLYNRKKAIVLDVKIEAVLDSVPEQYHEVFMNMLTAKYADKVSFSENPFSKCNSPYRTKWWEFWKFSKPKPKP